MNKLEEIEIIKGEPEEETTDTTTIEVWEFDQARFKIGYWILGSMDYEGKRVAWQK